MGESKVIILIDVKYENQIKMADDLKKKKHNKFVVVFFHHTTVVLQVQMSRKIFC